jgi:hypothetical protein
MGSMENKEKVTSYESHTGTNFYIKTTGAFLYLRATFPEVSCLYHNFGYIKDITAKRKRCLLFLFVEPFGT